MPSLGLASEIVLGLLVAMGDQAVEEATGLSGVVVASLCLFHLSVEVTGSLIVGIVMFVEIGCCSGQMAMRTGNMSLKEGLTILVTNTQLPAKLGSDVVHPFEYYLASRRLLCKCERY